MCCRVPLRSQIEAASATRQDGPRHAGLLCRSARPAHCLNSYAVLPPALCAPSQVPLDEVDNPAVLGQQPAGGDDYL